MRYLVKLLLALTSLLIQLAYAEEPSLNIKAIKADIDYKNSIVIYTGNVVITKGINRLVADKVISYYNKQHQLIKAIAFGNLAHLQQTATEEHPELHAYAKRIEYYPNQRVILIDKAKVLYGKNTMQAPYITYNIQTQELSSKPSTTERTTIILPKQQ